MPRYINEDDFCEYIRKNTTPSGAEWFISKINDMPAADVVEVVRCENCKYWVTRERELIAPYCEKIGIKYDNGYRDFDDFCSYGERKETE